MFISPKSLCLAEIYSSVQIFQAKIIQKENEIKRKRPSNKYSDEELVTRSRNL